MLPRRLVSLLFLPVLSVAVNAAESEDLSQLLLEQRCEACEASARGLRGEPRQRCDAEAVPSGGSAAPA